MYGALAAAMSAASSRMRSAGIWVMGAALRGFLYLVVTGAHNVILVGLVLTLGGIGHGVIVEANDISIEKLFVNLIVNNPLMG